jgi:demethylmenaquinone methyltransferase/2-methoxy-6-polyprenyl-1,4-benzoquinol methylase
MNLFQKPINQIKSEKIKNSFNQISKDYDSLNDVTSLGMHRVWKHKVAAEIKEKQFWKILDVCCGTGDMSLLLAKQDSRAQITAVDFSEEMLKKARYRKSKEKLANVEFLQQDAADLKFADGWFDCVVISFGLRDVADCKKVIQEAYRVLRPGGMFYCLDVAKMENPAVERAVNVYRNGVVPAVSGFFAGNYMEYTKIARTSNKFLTKKQLAVLLQKNGFVQVGCMACAGGLVLCHRAKKPDA